MRNYTMSEMLRDCRCGSQDSNDLPAQVSHNPASQGLTIRGFNLGLRDMLNTALGCSDDDACKRETEETRQNRGFGMGDMLEDAVRGSG